MLMLPNPIPEYAARYTEDIARDLAGDGKTSVYIGRLTDGAVRTRIYNAAGHLKLKVRTYREGDYMIGVVK
jgi:hypothetical protein